MRIIMRISQLNKGDKFTTLHRSGCLSWRDPREIYELTRSKKDDWGFVAVSDEQRSGSYGIAMDIEVFKCSPE